MTENATFKLADGAEARFIESRRFNTTLISFHFYLPLSADTLAEDALLPYLLTSCQAEYKTFTELNLKLLKLYGAELSCSVSKSGDFLHTKIGIRVIDSAFALGGEDTVLDATKLLLGIIFEPSLLGESFTVLDLEREKRKTVERIENEINNKRSYARSRHAELMFGDDPYGKFIYGTVSEVEKIDGSAMYKAWQRLLSRSSIILNVVGKECPCGIFEAVSKRLAQFDRSGAVSGKTSMTLPERAEPRTFREEMDVTQGKLVMGFSSKMSGSLDKAIPLMLLADIFGGGPYSRLFMNVREQQSLCYYCSAGQRRSKGYLIVDSGVEAENTERAKAAILSELHEIQNGVVEDDRLASSKRSVIDSLSSYNDSAAALDSFYTRDIMCDSVPTPEAAVELVRGVTAEQIIEAARGLKLHTVYELMPKKEVV